MNQAMEPAKKQPRICPTQYQAEIPRLKRKNSFPQPETVKKKRLESEGFKAVFLRNKISQQDIDQYLKLVRQMSAGINSADDQGTCYFLIISIFFIFFIFFIFIIPNIIPNTIPNITPNIIPNIIPNITPITIPNIIPITIPNITPNTIPNTIQG